MPGEMQRPFSEIASECADLARQAQIDSGHAMQDILVAAIYHDRLGELVTAHREAPANPLPDRDRALLDQAAATMRRISSDIEGHRIEITALLAAAGIDSEPVHGKAHSPQFHAFELRIARKQLAAVLDVIATADYPLARSLSGGAIAAIGATTDHLEVLRHGAPDMRLTLRWTPGFVSGRIPKKLKPTMADFRVAALPARLWPLYVALRPFRARLGPWIGLESDSGRDPVLSQVSLGTPHSLVTSLLRCADVSRNDRLVDFGCGDGRVVARALEELGCEVVGFESNAALAESALSRIKQIDRHGRSRIENRIGRPDDVRDATVVFLFQPMALAAQLVSEILANLPQGGRIIMHEQTALHPDLTPDRSVPVFSDNALTVAHIWQK